MSVFNLLFQNQTFKQTVFKNTFWLFIGQVLGRVLRATLIIYAARVLGAAQWGVFSYAIGVVAFLTIFTDLGINALLTKNTSRLQSSEEEKVRRQIISTSFFIKLIFIGVSLLILFIFAPWFSKIKEALPLFPIMALVLIFDNLREFGFSITRALEKMEVEAFFFILTNILIVLFGFIFLGVNNTPLYLAYGYALGTGIGMAATYIFLRKYFYHLWDNFSKELIKPILTSAWPFAMIGIMGGLMINTDIILLGWFRNAEELGFYAAAQKPVQALYVLPTLLATSLFPALARLAHQENKKAAEIIENAGRFLLLLAIPIVIVGIFLGADIIKLVFGGNYLPATLSWQILIATLLIIFPSMIVGNAIFAYDQQKLFIGVLFIGALSNIILDLSLIPRWGGPGSAVATLIAQFLCNLFLWLKLKKINPLIKNPDLKILSTASALMVISLLTMKFLDINFIVNAVISGLIYLGLLYALQEPLVRIFNSHN